MIFDSAKAAVIITKRLGSAADTPVNRMCMTSDPGPVELFSKYNKSEITGMGSVVVYMHVGRR